MLNAEAHVPDDDSLFRISGLFQIFKQLVHPVTNLQTNGHCTILFYFRVFVNLLDYEPIQCQRKSPSLDTGIEQVRGTQQTLRTKQLAPKDCGPVHNFKIAIPWQSE